MTTPSKGTELTKIERDAARYRALRRLFGELKAALKLGDVTAIGATALDHTCDCTITTEDVAQILIETTQPSIGLLGTSSVAIEENCAIATREIARSIERGIYQPMMPYDVIALLACAQKAEQANESVERMAQQILKISQGTSRETLLLMFLFAVLAVGGSLRIPMKFAELSAKDLELSWFDEGDATVYYVKRRAQTETG